MHIGLLLVLFFCMVAAAHAEQFTAKVIVVLDGDTLMVTRNRSPPVKVRLAEIDAPEMTQQGGVASKKSLSELVLHKQVSVSTLAIDKYGRLVANLTADGNNINEEQVRRGMAWAAVMWRQGLPAPLAGENSNYYSDKVYIALQNAAQQARRGLWAGDEIMEPAQWRKLHPEMHAAPRHTLPRLRVGDYTCGSKRHCSQMRSCEEAHFYLSHCGVKSLDTNRDGVPCKNVCGGRR